MHRRTFIKAFALSASVVAMGVSFGVQAAETIKVGIMHSLSGTMAISETPLKDVALMTIDEINAKGGVLGKKLEPVVVDPASNWPLVCCSIRCSTKVKRCHLTSSIPARRLTSRRSRRWST